VSRAMTRALILIPLFLLVLVVLFLLLRPSPTPETATTSESTVEERPQEKTFDLAVVEGTMTPDEIAVDEGDQVNLRITSDSPIEFHLHGYELEEEVEPGEPAELSFDATITGRFEIEDHNTDAVLGVLIVQPR
jgi:heme/copper-type cytochrome/quinol oxidase subunit 2